VPGRGARRFIATLATRHSSSRPVRRTDWNSIGRGLLPAGLRSKTAKPAAATLSHVLSFPAWQSLEQRQVADRDKPRLYQGWSAGCVDGTGTANRKSLVRPPKIPANGAHGRYAAKIEGIRSRFHATRLNS
jgi:hypothetical protein